jgi:type IV secretion system protein VirB10
MPEDQEDQPVTQKPGALPQAKQPLDRGRLYRYWRLNRGVILTLAIVLGSLLVVAVWLASRAANQPLKIEQADKTGTGFSVGRSGRAAAPTPLPGSETSNPAPTFDPNTPPPGVSPELWREMVAAYRRQHDNQDGTQPAKQETPADARRRRYEDLVWQGRLAAPDKGYTRKVSEPQPARQGEASPQEPDAAKLAETPKTASPAEDTKPAEEKKLVSNTCYVTQQDGAGYRVLGGLNTIKARILNQITADAKGPFIAEVIQPLYSWDASTLLIPKGSFLTGNAFPTGDPNQERVYLAVNEITMPNGCQVQFPEVEVLDQQGTVGVKDKVNHHYAQIFLTAIALNAVTAGASISTANGYTYSPQDVFRISVMQGGSQAAQQVMNRYGNHHNTLTLTAGKEIVLFVPIDFTLTAWKKHHAPIV